MKNLENKQRRRRLAWLAVAVWMAVIFLFSAQTAGLSGNMSGGITRWLVTLLYRGFSALPLARQEQILEVWHTVIRKGAHFTEYAILGMLLVNALGSTVRPGKNRWLLSVGISAAYAITDEVHQAFVPGRACRLLDMGIDTCGAALGAALVLLLLQIRQKVRASRESGL